jgi:hypothetical protein
LAIIPFMKVRWIESWNQSPALREALKFLKPRFSASVFSEWLYKATGGLRLVVHSCYA